MGVEPTTSSLEGWSSTTELRPRAGRGGEGWIRTIEGVEPADLQSAPFDRSGTSPAKQRILRVFTRKVKQLTSPGKKIAWKRINGFPWLAYERLFCCGVELGFQQSGINMTEPLNASALDTLFHQARSHNGWLDKPVDEALLHQTWNLARMGPTSANCSPMRVVFVKSAAAKARLLPALMEGNRAKTLAAPATAIFGVDSRFYDLLPKLFPHTDARAWFAGPGKETVAETTAFRNGTLQAAYFMLAARALGLDCGPMSGFDNAAVDREFFPDGRVKSNFICNLGHGDPSALFPRSPRLDFEEACVIA